MNTTTTNIVNEWYFSDISYFKIVNLIHFLLSLPLNTYIIFILSPGCGGTDAIEVFTLNQAVTNIIFGLTGPFQCLCYFGTDLCFLKPLGFLLGLSVSARPLFQCCVCFERYLAVVHPVTFLRYKSLRYRVAHSLMAWTCTLPFAVTCMFMFPYLPYSVLAAFCIFILVVDTICCMSILHQLRHPRPGDRDGRDREMNAVKRKAFQVVCVNLLVFLIQLIPVAATFGIQNKVPVRVFSKAMAANLTIYIITGFVQPILELNKAGKLPFIRAVHFLKQQTP